MHPSRNPSTERAVRPPLSRRSLVFLALLALAATDTSSATSAGGGRAERPSPEEALATLQAKYKQSDKKYATLAKKMQKAVQNALASTPWPEGGAERSLADHPWNALVAALGEAALQADGKKPAQAVLLTRFPWSEELELVQGLQFGSDRPIPAHDAGFIDLESPPDPFPGFPEQLTNLYLYGLQEIVGWRYRVEDGKKPAFLGRGAKDAPELEEELPGWEALRVYLSGSIPEVPLLAVPRLTHALHSRLAERRRSTEGQPARMDELLAFLDSKWNGFQFPTPYAKDRLAIALPVQALITDRDGFVYRFPPGARLREVGDIPFVSLVTLIEYGRVFRGEELTAGDFIRETPAGKACTDQFWADCTYLARYRTLLDSIARAVLAPQVPYPTYLRHLDYPEGKLPLERGPDAAFDVPRRHVLLLWAHAGKDPAVLADFLHAELLDQEKNRFPSAVSVAGECTQLVRQREQELLQAVAGHAAVERERKSGEPGDYEREFSPHATFLEPDGALSPDALLHSFHAFHAPLAAAIQDAAYAVLLEEIGD
jgi:hypothetical protein